MLRLASGSSSAWLSAALFALTLVACGGRVHVGTDDAGPGVDAGPRPDAQVDPVDGGGGGEVCGPVTCGPGTECCNASCGVCTPPGVVCTAIACSEACATSADCGSDQYCAYTDRCEPDCTDPGSCGGALPEDGVCVPRSSDCPAVVDEVCGCDGVTYSNSCEAAAAGVNVASDRACPSGPCAPQDIRGEGLCAAVIGIFWDGYRCGTVGGCGCEGTDCADMYELSESGEAQCYADHAGCASCDAMQAGGEGPCDAEIGIVWNGSQCQSISGCSCVGIDCARTYPTMGACQAAQAHCGGTGCTSDADCGGEPAEFCQFPIGSCPGDGATGTCTAVVGGAVCTLEQPPVCGCDGATYGCDEDARGQGQNVRFSGGCPGEGECAAFDAEGDGECFLELGLKWNGARCESIGGCECQGADCGRLYSNLAECEADHAGCELPPLRVCGGFAGTECRPDEFCDYPDTGNNNLCGGDDGTGICAPRPTGCFGIADPVCACNGMVYSNACVAMEAGFDVRSEDETDCPPAP